MNIAQEVVRRFLRTPSAKKIEREIIDEYMAQRRALEDEIARLEAERAAAVTPERERLAQAERDFTAAQAALEPAKAQVVQAHRRLKAAGRTNRSEIARLRAELAQLPAPSAEVFV